MKKIIDCFPFFNELDVLEIRLNELNDVVDYFVICESKHTHSGNEKPLFFLDNRKRFEPFLHKIIYVESDLSSTSGDWARENKQRQDLILGLNKIDDLTDKDLVLLSDADEIPSSIFIHSLYLVQGKIDFPVSITQSFFAYYLNMEGVNKEWIGTVVSPVSVVNQKGFQYLRNAKDSFPRTKGRAGWHFSYLGGPGAVLSKLKAFAHQENPFKDLSFEALADIFTKRVIRDKQFCFDNNSTPMKVIQFNDTFPDFILKNQDKLQHLIINE